MKWRIYYEDYERNHTEGLPVTADEKLGVMVIAQQRSSDGHYEKMSGAAYYIFEESGVWLPVGLDGLEDWIMNLLPRVKCVTKGRAISHEKFEEIYKRAQKAVSNSLD